jgi:hypothetical protein
MTIPLRYPRYISVIALFLTIVSAAQAKYSGGTGEPNDPYQIATAEDLMLLGDSPEDYDKHFILTADIDLVGHVFDKAVIAPPESLSPWGGFVGTRFAGVFDGSGHTISHLTIVGEEYLGLFGYLESGAEARDLCVVDVDIAGSSFVGGLAGINGGDLTHCHSTGAVSGTGDFVDFVVDFAGGLVGYNWNGIVTQCCSAALVSGDRFVGGLVGFNEGVVIQSYSTGAVNGNSLVGGLVGNNGEDCGVTAQSYSTGEVRGTYNVGGLVGFNEGVVTQCYSTGAISVIGQCLGGLVGTNWGYVLCSVWDVESSGLSGSAGGVGLTKAEMMDPYMLALNGFVNDPNWVLDAGRDYPRLAWEGTRGQVIPEPNIDCLSGRGTPEEPYQIDTAEQLILLGRAGLICDKHFTLGANIDLDPNLVAAVVFPQAVIPTFFGVFDGNEHTISHLTIKGRGFLGLFGYLAARAELRDLGVVDVNITGSEDYVGSLISYNNGTVTHCYSTGTISGQTYVGGLVGENVGNVHRCYSTGAVSGDWAVGGLVGHNFGNVTSCCSTGAVSAVRGAAGGLVGENGCFGHDGTATDCYSTATVSGGSSLGGLVGLNRATVIHCYSMGPVTGYGGGLLGYRGQGGAIGCFWDVETSGQATSDGGTGKTTAEMQKATTFLDARWDFVGETANGTADIWWIDEGKDYPRLWWESTEE